MVCPGPSVSASRIAPATLMPEDPPRHRPSCSRRSKTTGMASSSGIWKATSIGAHYWLRVILPCPMPSVMDEPLDFSSPVVTQL